MGLPLINRIEEWEKCVQAGQSETVLRELNQLPREVGDLNLRSRIANISFRINQPQIGIRILHGQLRRDAELRIDSNPEAFTEYAGCLMMMGSVGEAKKILQLARTQSVRAPFYLALIAIKEWDYQTAEKLLSSYLSRITNDIYHRSVVLANLAACHLHLENWDSAFEIIGQIKPYLKESNRRLLYGNCLEMEAQIKIGRGEFSEARPLLEMCESYIGASNNMSLAYAKKWQLLNRILERLHAKNGDAWDADIASHWNLVRNYSVQMKCWENVRELDLFRGIAEQNQKFVDRVYFGTPFPHYRERVLKLLSRYRNSADISNDHLWGSDYPSVDGISPDQVDLAQLLADRDVGPQGEGPRKLLRVLTSDFYAPFRIGQLFGCLYPEEHFNLNSSPSRVQQLIKRLRVHLESNYGDGIIVAAMDDGMRLRIGHRFQIRIPKIALTADSATNSNHLISIQEKFGSESFSALDLAQALKCSTRTASRVLKTLRDRNQIETVGRSKNTRFRVVG